MSKKSRQNKAALQAAMEATRAAGQAQADKANLEAQLVDDKGLTVSESATAQNLLAQHPEIKAALDAYRIGADAAVTGFRAVCSSVRMAAKAPADKGGLDSKQVGLLLRADGWDKAMISKFKMVAFTTDEIYEAYMSGLGFRPTLEMARAALPGPTAADHQNAAMESELEGEGEGEGEGAPRASNPQSGNLDAFEKAIGKFLDKYGFALGEAPCKNAYAGEFKLSNGTIVAVDIALKLPKKGAAKE